MSVNRLAHRERIDWHDHTTHQLVHPLRGVLQVTTGRGTWVVPPTRAVWLPANVPHTHQAHGPTEMRSLIFTTAVQVTFEEPTVLTVEPLLREVIRTLSDERTDLSPELRHHLEQVALHQLRSAETLPLRLPTPTDPRLVRLCAMLAADPADPRPLRELGREVGAAERTLSRLFRDETGFTFPQWRGRLRLHHAMLLLATGLPVTRVAADAGYASPSAFIEAFRLVFGITPGRWAGGGEPAS
ncbi:helix-turn-helix transcriptional regulator [Actinoplanes sp. NPDC051851]|uniref:AraC family transcriptional regulator n=1 Tax=Actinoplanes sp. NPDC051851 TaxID=3154753 RepID=UPI0034165101